MIFFIFCFMLGNRTAEFCIYILAGIFLRSNQNVLSKITYTHRAILLFVYITMFLITLGKDFYEISWQMYNIIISPYWYIIICRILGALSISLLLMNLMYELSIKYNYVSYWGTMSMGIYLVHGFALLLLDKYVPIFSGDSMYIVPYMMFMSTFLIFSSVAVIMLARKYTITRQLLLGEN